MPWCVARMAIRRGRSVRRKAWAAGVVLRDEYGVGWPKRHLRLVRPDGSEKIWQPYAEDFNAWDWQVST